MWTHKVLCCLCAPSYQKATWFTWNGTLCDIHVGHEIQSSRGNTICGAWDLLWLCHIVMDRYTSESLYNPVGRSKLSTMPVCSDNITVGILGWKLAANVLVHLATVSHQQCVKYIKLMKLKALYSSWHIRPLTHWWQRLQCNARCRPGSSGPIWDSVSYSRILQHSAMRAWESNRELSDYWTTLFEW